MHKLIVGTTGSGKTTLVKKLASQVKDRQNVLVLDPSPANYSWDADFITDDPEHFLDIVKSNTRCFCIVDESGDMIGRYGREMNQLATRTRHLGHTVCFIVQQPTMIDKTIRTQCRDLYLFEQSLYDTKYLAREFNDDHLLKAHSLNMGWCLYKRRGDVCKLINVFTGEVRELTVDN